MFAVLSMILTLVCVSTTEAMEPTPNLSDIPKPVPGGTSLAGHARPDISRFLNVRSAWSPSLSPDGTQLAFLTQISGEPQVWIVDARGGWPRQVTFGEPVTGHRWSPDGSWLFYSVDRGGNEREGFYLISPDGFREVECLSPADAFRRFGSFDADGLAFAYASTGRNGIDYDIHLFDIVSRTDREVFKGRLGLYADVWRPGSDDILLTEQRGEVGNNVYLLNLASGRVDTLLRPEEAATFEGLQWLPDGSGFYTSTNVDRQFMALARFDVDAAAMTILDGPESDVEEVALSYDGKYLAWTTNEGGYSALHARDMTSGRDMETPSLPPGIYSVNWARRAPVASIRVHGPQVPGDIWTWDLRCGQLHRATTSASAGLDLTRAIVPTHHSFMARDGVTIHGLLYLPLGVPSGELPPVLLSVHGGPTAQARPGFSGPHQYLLTRGVAIFDLNYRGSTGYGKAFARLNDRRLRENELGDLEDALLWLAENGLADADRAAIMGRSYGGYLTMAGVSRLPDLFRCGVAFVGVSNWITALEGASPELKASDRVEYGDVDDPEDREFFRQISPIAHVHKVVAPVMMIHGANDPRDPPTESDQFVRAIREQGGEVEYLRFPDEGHAIRKLSNQIIAYRRIAAFLENHLGLNAARRPAPPE